jgi:hypothetical protein
VDDPVAVPGRHVDPDDPDPGPGDGTGDRAGASIDGLAHASGAGLEVCPYLRLETATGFQAPLPEAEAWHRCIALGDPVPPSRRQQELVCLRAAHDGCPRFLRAGVPETGSTTAARWGAVSRPILVSLVLLALAGGISFGFVLQRGGFALVADPSRTPGPVAEVSPSPTPVIGPTATPRIPTPASTEAPTPGLTLPPTSPPTPAPTPAPTATPRAEPTVGSDRYAWLEPCPDAPDCWIYVVRPSVSLLIVADYFGHPLSTLLAWNPWITDPSLIRAGDEIRMPPPTR